MFDSLKVTKPTRDNITLKQFLEIKDLKSKGYDYYLDLIRIVTGKDGALWAMEDTSLFATMITEAVQPQKPTQYKSFKFGGRTFRIKWLRQTFQLGGTTYHLPTLREVGNSIFTNVTISRYAAIENMSRQFTKFTKDGELTNLNLLPELMASVYCLHDEKFSDELFIERRDMFLHAPMSAVWAAFFFHLTWCKKYMKLLRFLLKGLSVINRNLKGRLKWRANDESKL